MKKWIVLCLALAMVLSLAACGEAENAVYVQSVKDLMNMGGIAPGDKFPGIVVSENITEVNKDEQMVVQELFVREGDDVTEGQKLFAYDTQQMQLSLNKQQLELEQAEATIENYKEQIKELERDRNNASNKLEYTIQIQSLEVDLQEAEINIKAKRDSVAQAEALLQNAVVFAPVDGRIQSISENGMDNYGNPLPYITIQKTGSYRIKGTLGELQRGAIMEGVRLEVLSRTDGSIWAGTVSLIDYENPTQGNGNEMNYGMATDELTSSSKYPFYVELDSTEGLMLGQHVYLQLETQAAETPAGPAISSAFIAYEEDGSTYVWADKNGKLEKRTVSLGEYNMMNDTYEILSGLTEDDFIAFPDLELCVEGAPTTKVEPAQDAPAQDVMVESGVAY